MKKIGIISTIAALTSLYLSPDAAEGAQAEDKKEDKPEDYKVKLGTITNNEISIDLFELKQTRGRDIGGIYVAPDLENLTKAQLVGFWPEDVFMENFARPALKKFCNQITKAAREFAKGDAAVFFQKWTEYFKELTAKSDSIRALKLKHNELLQEFRKVDHTKEDGMQKFLEIGIKIKQILNQIAELQDIEEEAEVAPTAEVPAQQAA